MTRFRLSPRLAIITKILFGTIAVGFLIVAFLRTMENAEGSVVPSSGRLGGAFLLAGLGLLFAGRSWVSLFEKAPYRAELISTFFQAQAAKYIPGSVWQPISLVASTGRASALGIARVSVLVVVHMFIQLVAVSTIGAGLVLSVNSPEWIRGLALTSLLGLAFLKRSWMIAPLQVFFRLMGKNFSGDSIPLQRRLLASYAWGLPSMFCSGSAFALLLAGSERAQVGVFISSFAFAWAVGFVALPFPSGIGIRELVLVSAIGTPGTSAAIIAASAFHRLVTIAAEFVAILFSTARTRRLHTRVSRGH